MAARILREFGMVHTLFTSFAAAALFCSAPLAQPTAPLPVPRPLAATPEHWDDVRVSDVLGRGVTNPAGEDLGRVEDLVLDSSTRRVHFVVVSFGGWLGLGDRHHLFMLERFARAPDGKRLLIDVPRARLAGGPSFAPGQWPAFAGTALHDYARRGLERRQPGEPLLVRRFIRASQMLGSEVLDREGKDAAEVEDIVVNLSSGAVRYAVLDPEDGAPGRRVALPFSALDFPQDPDRPLRLALPLDLARLAR